MLHSARPQCSHHVKQPHTRSRMRQSNIPTLHASSWQICSFHNRQTNVRLPNGNASTTSCHRNNLHNIHANMYVGTRAASALTPSQLARKRASDREAQRAIRARTKEHIARLEREVEVLKSGQRRDSLVQELLRINKSLEEELARIRESVGVSVSTYIAPHWTLPASTCANNVVIHPCDGTRTNDLSDYGCNLSIWTGAASNSTFQHRPGEAKSVPGERESSNIAHTESCEIWTASAAGADVSNQIALPLHHHDASPFLMSRPTVMVPGGGEVGNLSSAHANTAHESYRIVSRQLP